MGIGYLRLIVEERGNNWEEQNESYIPQKIPEDAEVGGIFLFFSRQEKRSMVSWFLPLS